MDRIIRKLNREQLIKVNFIFSLVIILSFLATSANAFPYVEFNEQTYDATIPPCDLPEFESLSSRISGNIGTYLDDDRETNRFCSGTLEERTIRLTHDRNFRYSLKYKAGDKGFDNRFTFVQYKSDGTVADEEDRYDISPSEIVTTVVVAQPYEGWDSNAYGETILEFKWYTGENIEGVDLFFYRILLINFIDLYIPIVYINAFSDSEDPNVYEFSLDYEDASKFSKAEWDFDCSISENFNVEKVTTDVDAVFSREILGNTGVCVRVYDIQNNIGTDIVPFLGTEGTLEREKDIRVPPPPISKREEPTLFNPSEFLTCDQPQPQGTVCHNGYWVPQLVSQWSCQETDFPPTNPAYNNPTISSSCRKGEIIQRDTCGCFDQDAIFTTDCIQGFTRVAEYSCSNNCKNPTIKKCPEGTQCITGRDGGACKSPNFENLESTPGIEYGLFQYPLELSEEEVTIILTDNDLINSALCSSSTIGLSNLEVVETPLAGTAAVIKQITGFFSRITGKQTASPIARREYHQTLTTNAYSELANIRAYIPVVYFNENGARSSQRKARILDRKVGSALLKTYGLERNNNLDALIASKQRSGEHSISGQGIIIREKASTTGSEEGFVTKIATSDYRVFAGIPEIRFNEFRDLTFILVEAREDKYFEINSKIYSISKGLYLVPYPINEDLRYNLISDPSEVDTELRTYYEIAFDFRSKKYDVGVETKEEFGFCTTIAGVISMQVTFLTPAEADYFLRDIPSTFGEDYRFPSKTFTYIPTRRTSVEYFIIPLGRDYGGFKEGVYFVPARSIISMNNEYDLSTRANEMQGMRHRPPTPNVDINYATKTLDKIAELEAEKRRLEGRIPCVSDVIDLGEDIARFIFMYRGEQIESATDSS